MNSAKVIIAGAGAGLILIGGTVYYTLDSWFSPHQGPGSGDEIAYEAEPTGPGSGDEMPAEPTGPGSGDEMPYEPEPTGPGSGDEMPAEPTGPGSGDEMPAEPTGPGSGDEMPYEPEPTGPGSGDEVPPEPTGPGSGDTVPQTDEKLSKVIGSCNKIPFGSICIDYIGSFWSTIDYAIMNCSDIGSWSENPCPRPSLGGCSLAPGTPNEVLAHYYAYGGDPVTPDNLPNVIGVCNVNPMGTWLYGAK